MVETELESTIEAREALLARIKTMADGLAKLPKATAEAGLQAAARIAKETELLGRGLNEMRGLTVKAVQLAVEWGEACVAHGLASDPPMYEYGPCGWPYLVKITQESPNARELVNPT